MKYKITLAKTIDGKKVRAEIDVEIKSKAPCAPYMRTDHKVFDSTYRFKEISIMGSLTGAGYGSAGQCLDEIAQVFSDDENVQTVHRIWKRYHLNGMHAACEHQKVGPSSDPAIMNQTCQGYKYGSAWLFEEVPADVIAELQKAVDALLSGPPVQTHAEDFAQKHDITLSVVKVLENPNMQSNRPMRHYQVRLSRKVRYGQEARFVTFFSMGEAHKRPPTLNEILPCLAMDASLGEESFEEFCSNLGYDPDLLSSKRAYEVVQEQSKKLKQFLGNGFQELLSLQ